MMDTLIKISCILVIASLIPQVSFPLSKSLIEPTVHDAVGLPSLDNEITVTIQRVREFRGRSFKMVVNIEDDISESDMYQGIEQFPNWSVIKETTNPNGKVLILLQITDRFQNNIGSVEIDFDMKTGDWTGGDYRGDADGYGHVRGNTFEMWFDIFVQGEDYDKLTQWEEINIYETSPLVDDRGVDSDNDGVPIEWEDHWGYNPFIKDNHDQLDPDNDGLSNLDEYRTHQWFSDPFRQDVFIEVDWMTGEHVYEKPYVLPERAKQWVMTAFAKQDIMLNIDDGWMDGGEEIPFYDESELNLHTLYRKHFLHHFTHIWKQGIFHYAVLMGVNPWVKEVAGFNFQSDGFTICIGTIREYRFSELSRTLATAGVFMHELGHNLGLFNSDFKGIDNPNTRYPWQEEFWLYGPYHSCMNYRYTWHFVDYSHGTHGEYDYDDWGNLNLRHFLG